MALSVTFNHVIRVRISAGSQLLTKTLDQMKKQQILKEFIQYSGNNKLFLTTDGRVINNNPYKEEYYYDNIR